jgi:hypothetical protein
MMKTLAQLLDERHAAYLIASAKGFASGTHMEVWRNANREYVLARDTKALMTPKSLVAA